VCAGTRPPLAHPDGPVTLLTLEVTSTAQTQAAAEQQGSMVRSPPAGYEQRGAQMELASSMEGPMHDRVLDRLSWLAAAISSGHHLNHLIPPGELEG
jgi:hypothetical protein